jgi:hypothetical protein
MRRASRGFLAKASGWEGGGAAKVTWVFACWVDVGGVLCVGALPVVAGGVDMPFVRGSPAAAAGEAMVKLRVWELWCGEVWLESL